MRLHARCLAWSVAVIMQVKEVLSANELFPLTIESLAADKDFKLPLNRTSFEQWCMPLFARVTAPIDAALADAGMTLVRGAAVAA